ncbi:hypothetical protein SESBI_41022 [Sesbania bispinosa]|nr:hypothetical protein SESBI_41022 [Sesbania bispinosa]
MKSFQVKGKETEQLHQLYKKLEQDWHAFKQSKPTTASRKYQATSNVTIQQGENSPRSLMFKLQQRSSSWEAQEILQEGREAIESGKLKGRRLFQSMIELDQNVVNPEVKSMSFYYPEPEENESSGSKGVHGYSSSSSCLDGSSIYEEQEVKGVAHMVATVAEIRVIGRNCRPGNGTTYAVFFGTVLAIAFFIVAMCMCLARSSGGCDWEVILVPT